MTATIHRPLPSLSGEPPRPCRWTRDEYYRIADLGLLVGRRVQLIDGEIIEMGPQGSPHYIALSLVTQALQQVFGAGYWVRPQGPVVLFDDSEPEPDVAVVKGRPRTLKLYPTMAELIVEVSDTSLGFDLGRKASLYARAGITDYWVLDLLGRRLIVHRQLTVNPAAPHGHRYADIRTLSTTDKIAPLAMPQSFVQVADLLP